MQIEAQIPAIGISILLKNLKCMIGEDDKLMEGAESCRLKFLRDVLLEFFDGYFQGRALSLLQAY